VLAGTHTEAAPLASITMTFEDFSLAIKQEAARRVLDRLPRSEQELVESLYYRDPEGSYEQEVWGRFRKAQAAECHRLSSPKHWPVPDLMELLSEAQARALKQAQYHLAWTDADVCLTLRQALPTLIERIDEELAGNRNREPRPLTGWTEWQEIHDCDA
jgi:hypothetical protein